MSCIVRICLDIILMLANIVSHLLIDPLALMKNGTILTLDWILWLPPTFCLCINTHFVTLSFPPLPFHHRCRRSSPSPPPLWWSCDFSGKIKSPSVQVVFLRPWIYCALRFPQSAWELWFKVFFKSIFLISKCTRFLAISFGESCLYVP